MENSNFKKGIILSRTISTNQIQNEKKINDNIFLLGSAKTGKSRAFIEPNLIQRNGSYVIVDPGKELYKKYADFLWENGYEIKILDLERFTNTQYYNPLFYCKDKTDVYYLAKKIMHCNVEFKEDIFLFHEETIWAILSYCISILSLHPEKDERTYGEIPEIMGMSCIKPNLAGIYTLLLMADNEWNRFCSIFKNLERYERIKNSEKNSSLFHGLFQKISKTPMYTLKNILLNMRKAFSFLEEDRIRMISEKDTMELEKIGVQKTIIFISASPMSRSYNFLANLLYSQLIELL